MPLSDSARGIFSSTNSGVGTLNVYQLLCQIII